MWSFTITIYGETYIAAGIPYMVTCNVSQFKEGRITNFNANVSDTDQLGFTIRHSTEFGCFFCLVHMYFVKVIYVPVIQTV